MTRILTIVIPLIVYIIQKATCDFDNFSIWNTLDGSREHAAYECLNLTNIDKFMTEVSIICF